VAREDTPGDKRLVAYLVAGEGVSAPEPVELRRHLLSQLPDYMVPAAFVWLVALPLTQSGKIDRRALPAPGSAELALEHEFVAPRTPREEVLAGLWADLLRLERVGVFDNFFALGGHSLLATQVISRIRVTFGVELPLRAVFEAPTVAGLAAEMDGVLLRATSVEGAPIARSPGGAAVVCPAKALVPGPARAGWPLLQHPCPGTP